MSVMTLERRPLSPSGPPTFEHRPVMVAEVVAWLRPVPQGLFIDATVGGAGHAMVLLDAFPEQHLLGLDRDPFAVEVATDRLARFGDRAHVRHTRYDHIVDAAAVAGGGLPVTGILMDLGVSSAQFDLAERGFSYRLDAPLDMRMDTSAGRNAADIVNGDSDEELAELLRVYGDERFAWRIARAIVAARPIRTTTELAQVVVHAIPAATRRTGGHPAKRTFQALRIAVNDELAVLERALDDAIDLLHPVGRLVVLAYHSGEDRIVKNRFRNAETDSCSCPPGLPCVCGALPRGRSVRRGVVRPQAAEVAANPRAASAVARVFERIGPATPSAGPIARNRRPPRPAVAARHRPTTFPGR